MTISKLYSFVGNKLQSIAADRVKQMVFPYIKRGCSKLSEQPEVRNCRQWLISNSPQMISETIANTSSHHIGERLSAYFANGVVVGFCTGSCLTWAYLSKIREDSFRKSKESYEAAVKQYADGMNRPILRRKEGWNPLGETVQQSERKEGGNPLGETVQQSERKEGVSGVLGVNEHDSEEKVGLSSSDTGRGKSKMSKNITHGYHMVEGKSHHTMEDYVFAQFKQVDENKLGLFAIFDGHLSHEISEYLRSHLFNNILNEPNFWAEPESAIRKAYRITDTTVLDKVANLGKGGSTAVTAILINGQKLVVANVGDYRAVIYKNGVAKQLSIDHEPGREREIIEGKGGFVSKFPGDVPRVDGQLAVARAFGDKSLKMHLSSEPDVVVELIDDDTEFLILASDGVWKVLSNQEAANCIKDIKDARSAAKHLNEHALARGSTDDISCVVVRLQ